MIGLRSFIPESYTSLADRMAKARVPKECRVARTKPEIALAEIDCERPQCRSLWGSSRSKRVQVTVLCHNRQSVLMESGWLTQAQTVPLCPLRVATKDAIIHLNISVCRSS